MPLYISSALLTRRSQTGLEARPIAMAIFRETEAEALEYFRATAAEFVDDGWVLERAPRSASRVDDDTIRAAYAELSTND